MAAIQRDAFYNIINGQQRSAHEQNYGVDPCTGERLWPVPIATQREVDEAVGAAQGAFPRWRDTALADRKAKLGAIKDILLNHSDNMTNLLCLETGKPHQTAEMEVKHMVAGFFDYHISLQIPDEEITSENSEKTITTRYTPLGVVGAICPW